MKNYTTIVSIIFLLLVGFLQAEDKALDQKIIDGQNLLFQGKYKEAVQTLETVLSDRPNSTTALLYLAHAYSYQNQLIKAEEPLKKILAQQVDHIEAGQLLAQVYESQEKYLELVKILKPLLEFRHDYTNYRLLARASYKLNKLKDAQAYYEKAIEMNNKNSQDHYDLGNIYLSNMEYAKAVNSFNRAMNLKLESPELHYNLATAYFNLRNYFGKIKNIDVKSGAEGDLYGQWYLLEKLEDEGSMFIAAPRNSAIYHIAKIMKSDLGKKFDIQLLKANVFLNGRRFVTAKKLFAELEHTVPKDERALFYYYFSQACLGDYDYDGFIKHLNRAIELDPKNYESSILDAYLKVASWYRQNGDQDKSITYMQKAIGKSPKSTSLHMQMARDYEAKAEYQKAVLHWKMVLALEYSHPERSKIVNYIEKYRLR